jgi:hypothetical protein
MFLLASMRTNLSVRLRWLVVVLIALPLWGTVQAQVAVRSCPSDPQLLERKMLGQIGSADGFAFLSGYCSDVHIHPTIFAHGYPDMKLTVIGPSFRQDFPLARHKQAYEAYVRLLREVGAFDAKR